MAEPRKKTWLHFHCKFLHLRLSGSEVSLVSQASSSELLLLYVLVKWVEDYKEIWEEAWNKQLFFAHNCSVSLPQQVACDWKSV